MKITTWPAWLLLAAGTAASATDYMVDFSRMDDLEALRPLVRGCKDFDAMEIYRTRMETSINLESMRTVLGSMGVSQFNDCPEGLSGAGIAALQKHVGPETPSYSVDFSRVSDFETLRPLIDGCADFEGLERMREELRASPNLNKLGARLREIGFGNFNECPAGVTGAGIAPVD